MVKTCYGMITYLADIPKARFLVELVRPYFDEVVVVYTSEELPSDFEEFLVRNNVRLVRFRWIDNFAQARNQYVYEARRLGCTYLMVSESPNLGSGYAGWDGIGTGAFKPNPGDYICVTVTYNPSTNTLSGVAYDLNTGQSASFTVNLGNNYTPPGSGSYVFGIAGSTGGAYANWAVVYVNYQG